jgi:hypothetical protein
MAIYNRHGKRILSDTVQIDSDCYVHEQIVKLRALVEGANVPGLFYVSDLRADRGRTEIDDIIRAALKSRRRST